MRGMTIIVAAFGLFAWDVMANHGRIVRSTSQVLGEAARQAGFF